MREDVRSGVEAARRNAVPLPWIPPTQQPTMPVHQVLVAEAVGHQLRRLRQLTDDAGLLALSHELGCACGVFADAVSVLRARS